MRTTRIPWRGAAILVAVALMAMLAGAALRGATDQPTATASHPTPAAGRPSTRAGDGAAGDDTTAAGPRDRVEGVGVGFARSEAGAVAAAVSYATAGQNWLYLSDDQVA